MYIFLFSIMFHILKSFLGRERLLLGHINSLIQQKAQVMVAQVFAIFQLGGRIGSGQHPFLFEVGKHLSHVHSSRTYSHDHSKVNGRLEMCFLAGQSSLLKNKVFSCHTRKAVNCWQVTSSPCCKCTCVCDTDTFFYLYILQNIIFK